MTRKTPPSSSTSNRIPYKNQLRRFRLSADSPIWSKARESPPPGDRMSLTRAPAGAGSFHFRLFPGSASPVDAPPLVLTLKRKGSGSLACRSSSGPGPGRSESKNVLDAFFLGKALAEALNERIESTVGEFLSTFGRLQAKQQKQVQEFQEEVLERAKRSKERAEREALEAQGLIPASAVPTNESAGGSTPASTEPAPHLDAGDVTMDLEVDNSGIGVSNTADGLG